MSLPRARPAILAVALLAACELPSRPGNPVASVTVAPTSASAHVGDTLRLSATPWDSSGNILAGRRIAWTSDSTAVATVTSSGLVRAVAAGSSTIRATSEGRTGTAAVTVTAAGGGSAPFGHVFVVTEDNVVRRLLAGRKTWKSYAEDLPAVGYTGGDVGNYARKHNVFALLSDVANDRAQTNRLVPFTQFATDLANGTLPTFSNIVPNLCNDAHDCGLDVADSWLQTNIAPLIASPVFQQDGLLIIVFDEACGDNTNGGGRIVWVAVSPKAKRAYQSTTLYQHPSTLRLILKGLGVSVFPGAAASAPDMSEFFTP